MSSEGPYGRQGFQSNPSGYGSSSGGSSYTQQPVYGYGGAAGVPGGGGYGAPPPPPSSGGYDYNNPYGGNVDVPSSPYEVCTCRLNAYHVVAGHVYTITVFLFYFQTRIPILFYSFRKPFVHF
jgi:hypothetical protein